MVRQGTRAIDGVGDLLNSAGVIWENGMIDFGVVLADKEGELTG